MTAKKFATQIDEQVLKDLKKYVQESGRSISRVVSDAVVEHLQKVRVRPAFRSAMDEVLNEKTFSSGLQSEGDSLLHA